MIWMDSKSASKMIDRLTGKKPTAKANVQVSISVLFLQDGGPLNCVPRFVVPSGALVLRWCWGGSAVLRRLPASDRAAGF